MAVRLLAHLRRQWIGVIALFVALSGGVAWATHPGGANTISSGDIINEQVRSLDLADNGVKSVDIEDAGVKQIDIDAGAVSLAKLKANSVNSSKVVNESLTGDDVADGSITDADTSGLVPYGDVLWAVVNSDGSLSRASNGTTTSVLEAAGSGDYEVDFGNGNVVDPCASIAQISGSNIGFDELPGQAASAQGEPSGTGIDVRTFDNAGAAADRAFTVHVLCPELTDGGGGTAKSADRGRR
jgi:hypothetical protein